MNHLLIDRLKYYQLMVKITWEESIRQLFSKLKWFEIVMFARITSFCFLYCGYHQLNEDVRLIICKNCQKNQLD